MDMSEVRARPGTMCALLASLGNSGKSISHSCVDVILFQSGIIIEIGLLVG